MTDDAKRLAEPSTMSAIIRERKTEEKVRALDVIDIVEWVHVIENERDEALTRLEEAREVLGELEAHAKDNPGNPVAHMLEHCAVGKRIRRFLKGGE